jgi:ribosomal 50S subunit-recycling heat shock protein
VSHIYLSVTFADKLNGAFIKMENKDLIRINKYFSEIGYCSRREADKLIEQRRVTINGTVAEMGSKVSYNDEVRLNGKLISPKVDVDGKKKKHVYLLLNKPRGIVCTTDIRREKNNIIDFINYPERIFPIGRLDKDSQGLILLTSDGEYVKIQSSTAGDGIDIVFLGDGYTVADIISGKFEDNLLEAIDHFFDIEPYRTYRNYFDVYIVYAYSEESGISDIQRTRKTKFSAKFESATSTRMSIDHTSVFEYAQKVPLSSDLSETQIAVIANSTRYGGTNWSYSNGMSISVVPVSNFNYPNDFRGVVQHEIGGHGFGQLADEYTENNSTIPQSEKEDLLKWQQWGFFENVDLTDRVEDILWSHLINDPDYSYVGVYEGGFYYSKGVWRSEPVSLMNNNIRYINAQGREQIVMRIKELAGETYSFEEFKQKDVRETQSLTRSAVIYDNEEFRLPPPILIEVN